MSKFSSLLFIMLLFGGGWCASLRKDPSALDVHFPTGLHSEFILKWDEHTKPSKAHPVLFNVNPKGKPFLHVGSNFIAAKYSDESKAESIPVPGSEGISDFAFTPGGSMMMIVKNRLMILTKTGLQLVQTLPEAGMKLTPASADEIYLYGGNTREQQGKLYLYKKGGKLLYLMKAESPIAAVAGTGEFTFVAIDKAVYLYAAGEPLTVLLRAENPITSLAVGPDSTMFFSTTESVGFSEGKGKGLIFVSGEGADIQARDETLYLYFPKTGIMKCSPASLFLKTSKAN